MPPHVNLDNMSSQDVVHDITKVASFDLCIFFSVLLTKHPRLHKTLIHGDHKIRCQEMAKPGNDRHTSFPTFGS